MTFINYASKEINCKIVYYGPGLGGKTTTLEHIHATAKPEHRGKLVSLATPVDRTLYFDFLPVRLPPVRARTVALGSIPATSKVRSGMVVVLRK